MRQFPFTVFHHEDQRPSANVTGALSEIESDDSNTTEHLGPQVARRNAQVRRAWPLASHIAEEHAEPFLYSVSIDALWRVYKRKENRRVF